MKEYIKTPLSYNENHAIIRNINERISMIDNFIELIVFTPRGSFAADSDFGFEYWNHEYSNIHFRDFNRGQNGNYINGLYGEITKKECQDSIKKSLEAYNIQLKQIDVTVELKDIKNNEWGDKRISSKYEVIVKVTGILDNGLGTFTPYKKEIYFLMEPTVKRLKI